MQKPEGYLRPIIKVKMNKTSKHMKQNSWADSRMKFYGELNASGLIEADEIENFLKSSIEFVSMQNLYLQEIFPWLWTI